MPLFITRVELHNATSYTDYQALHGAMERQGFSRQIKSSESITYHLPEAEYVIAESSASTVLSKAKAAASNTGKSFGVLVSGNGEIRFYGLTEV